MRGLLHATLINSIFRFFFNFLNINIDNNINESYNVKCLADLNRFLQWHNCSITSMFTFFISLCYDVLQMRHVMPPSLRLCSPQWVPCSRVLVTMQIHQLIDIDGSILPQLLFLGGNHLATVPPGHSLATYFMVRRISIITPLSLL